MSKLLDKLKAATPEKQEFILKDLANSLAKGKKFDKLCQLLTDFDYLQLKLENLGDYLLLTIKINLGYVY